MTESEPRTTEPAAPVRVTLELPSGLVAAYDALVDARIYSSRENALVHGLVDSYRHNQGAHYSIRLDVDVCRVKSSDKPEATPAEDDAAPDSPEV